MVRGIKCDDDSKQFSDDWLSFIIRQYQQTQNLKSWQTEKYINNEYISLTHGVEEQEAWVYCMQ